MITKNDSNSFRSDGSQRILNLMQTAVIASSDDDDAVPPTPEAEVNKGRKRRRVKKLVSRYSVQRYFRIYGFVTRPHTLIL